MVDSGTGGAAMRLSVELKCWIVISAAAVFAVIGHGRSAEAAEPVGYSKVVEPFFKAYCVQCHSGVKAEGGFRVDARSLPPDWTDPAARSKWKEVVNVLNSHEMPPKKSKQPVAREVAAVVDWITAEAVKAESARRENSVVLRRLNREEYRNTIRELLGVDVDISGFPADPQAGGFDNIGAALTTSPLHLETYLSAARKALDEALVDGDRPTAIRWRFDPTVAAMDRVRVRLDPKNNPIVNGGNNKAEGEWVVVHHQNWDKGVGARDFRVPTAGTYVIRMRAAGRRPDRAEVVKAADGFLAHRQKEQDDRNPKGAQFTKAQRDRDLLHFQNDRMYDYGPPRAKLVLQLGPQPKTVAEFDVDGSPDKPRIHEFTAKFTTETAGVGIEYAYAIPRVLENFWMQGHDRFARPELMIDWFEIEGPIFDAWPPSSHRAVLGDMSKRSGAGRVEARAVLARFMRRAYRRPVTAAEIDAKLARFDEAVREGAGFIEAIKRPLSAVLVSPNFLFLTEPGDRIGRSLTAHETAARLSYLLWSSMPDADLDRAADTGKLSDPAERIRQVDRMLKDPRSTAFTANFAGQWLSLREVGTNPPAADLYPQYDRHLETSMVAESQEFFRELLVNDLSALNLIRSDFAVINERMARFYGISGVRGDQFRKVPVPPGVHRGGVVTQASILTITSNGTRTSPVKRGTWVLKTMLGIDPGLPVANAGEIAPKVPGIDKATVRKRLEIHRTLEQCARCHNKIDPLGFALENFNAAGEWREQEGFGYKGRIERNDPKIDASSEMPDGTKIVGVDGLQQALLKQSDLFLNALAGRLMTYAIGRELGLADQPHVRTAVAQMKQQGTTIRGLLHAVVRSEPFNSK